MEGEQGAGQVDCSSGETLCKPSSCFPGNNCTSTAPTNLSVTYTSPTSAKLTWTHGVNGVYQRLYVGQILALVDDLCRVPYSCPIVFIAKENGD
jgi:hypothetical protein